MKAIFKREVKNYFKNPVYWIGMVLVILMVYQMVSPFLAVRYFQTEEEITEQEIGEDTDLDIMQGYVLSTKEQQIEIGLAMLEQAMENYKENERKGEPNYIYWESTEEDPKRIIQEVREQNFSEILDTEIYLEEQYQIWGSSYYFEEALYHRGDMEEVNSYLEGKLEEHPYSYYFSRKFADFAGLVISFFAVVLLAFLFLRDTRKDIYELLHTKPIKAKSYVIGKIAGGMTAIMIVLIILNLIFGSLCIVHARQEGLPVSAFDFLFATAVYIVPNMMMIVCVYAAVSILFKNPLPATPLLFLYIVYSNMGSKNAQGDYGYFGRPFAIMVRFPGTFLDTTPPPLVLWNQSFLVIASIVLICLTIMVFKRRRFY